MQNTSETKQILNYNTIIIIILLFIFSSKIWNSIWEIGKSLVYAIIFLYLLNLVNPDIVQKIKKLFINYLTTNYDTPNGILKNFLSKLANNLLNIISPTKIMSNNIINNIINNDNNLLSDNNDKKSIEISAQNSNLTASSTQNRDMSAAPTNNRNFVTDKTTNRNLIVESTENRNLNNI
jgi:hypothetical protein